MEKETNTAISWHLKQHFSGPPKLEDFQLVKEPLQDLKDNEVTIEAVYLSPDPYQRLFSRGLQPPCVMMGTTVAKVSCLLFLKMICQLFVYISGHPNQKSKLP